MLVSNLFDFLMSLYGAVTWITIGATVVILIALHFTRRWTALGHKVAATVYFLYAGLASVEVWTGSHRDLFEGRGAIYLFLIGLLILGTMPDRKELAKGKTDAPDGKKAAT